MVRRLSVALWRWWCFLIYEAVSWLSPFDTFDATSAVAVSWSIIRYPLCVVYLFALLFYAANICVWHIIGIAVLSPFSTLCPSVSSSLWQLTDVKFLHRYILFPARLAVVFLDILVCCSAAFGVVFVLQYAAVGVLIFLQFAFIFSQQNLPEYACCVLFACYLWKSYRSFTLKYQDLAEVLIEKHYQLKDNGRTTGLQDITPDHGRSVDGINRIPKALFDMACEELMPIRKSVCKMFLETTLGVLLIFLVFSLATLLSVSPAMKALLIFAVGSIPMIVTIFLDRRRRRNFKAERFDQNVGEIVKKFFNTVPHMVIRGQIGVSSADSCKDDGLMCLMSLAIFANLSITAIVLFPGVKQWIF